MVSRTVMAWLLVVVLLQRSRATQVRVMSVGQTPLVTAEKVTTGLVAQLSSAVTSAGEGTSARHWKFVAAGTPTRTGGVISRTVMVWRLVKVLLQKSRRNQ